MKLRNDSKDRGAHENQVHRSPVYQYTIISYHMNQKQWTECWSYPQSTLNLQLRESTFYSAQEPHAISISLSWLGPWIIAPRFCPEVPFDSVGSALPPAFCFLYLELLPLEPSCTCSLHIFASASLNCTSQMDANKLLYKQESKGTCKISGLLVLTTHWSHHLDFVGN